MRFTLSLAMCPPAELLPLARAAEEAGWDAVALPDSVFFPEEVSADYPYTADGSRFWRPDTPFVEPLVAIPAMAAVTERLTFTTNVYKVVLRHPLLVAKALGSLAAMFPGRISIGLGISWIPEEFAWLGQDMHTRGRRLDETVDILRATLRPGYAEHRGREYDFGRLAMSPAPTGPVPIYIGGLSEPALRRAARVGDGWIGTQMAPGDIAATIERLDDLRAEAGRGGEPFEVMVTPLVPATPAAMVDLAAAGVTDVITVPWFYWPGDHHDPAVKRAGIERFATEVIEPVRASAASRRHGSTDGSARREDPQ
jgi:probable F420-dependent oxidoreductase